MLLAVSLVILSSWVYLLLFRGAFWRPRIRIDDLADDLTPESSSWPDVAAVVPARNEADVVAETVRALVASDYPGRLRIWLVDDGSTDGTAAAAREAAGAAPDGPALEIVDGAPPPSGWAGKVWAMQCGFDRALAMRPDFILFSDADIVHDAGAVRRLVAEAEAHDLDLVSQMVMLSARGFWESLLVPAFVYFFAKLYPFVWVNDPGRRTAAAAGGCMLVRRVSLQRAGGLARIRDRLIDDCALAAVLKADGRPGGGRVWLGWTAKSSSIRSYGGLAGVWRMVVRTAYTQLHYHPAWLAATVAGMVLLYLAGPTLLLFYPLHGAALPAVLAAAAYLLSAMSLVPHLRLYRRPPWLGSLLPVAALLYTAMTVWSAVAYYRGRGGAWKGRVVAGGLRETRT